MAHGGSAPRSGRSSNDCAVRCPSSTSPPASDWPSVRLVPLESPAGAALPPASGSALRRLHTAAARQDRSRWRTAPSGGLRARAPDLIRRSSWLFSIHTRPAGGFPTPQDARTGAGLQCVGFLRLADLQRASAILPITW